MIYKHEITLITDAKELIDVEIYTSSKNLTYANRSSLSKLNAEIFQHEVKPIVLGVIKTVS